MISIIIPTFNSEKFLAQCLDAVKGQNISDGQIEIIIADNGSTDSTVDIAKKYTGNIIVEENANVSGLRNIGAKQSKGDILFFLDSDCVPANGWIENALRIIETQNVGATGCWYQISNDSTWVEKVWDAHMSWRRETGRYVSWIPSGNLIIKKNVFDSVNGFNDELQTGEDTDICNRLVNSGNNIFASPDIAVIHLGEAKTISEFYSKQKWHGSGAIQRFVREFPTFIADKTFIYSCVLLIVLFGMIKSILGKNILDLLCFILLALLIPAIMSVKTILRTTKYKYFFMLLFLYLVYGIARTTAFLNLNLWLNEIIRRKK